MAILRWSAARNFILLHERMGKMFDDALAALSLDPNLTSLWIPPCDIYETEDNFVLKAEAPGVELDDIVIEIRNNEITFAGERKKQRSLYAATYHRVERNGGRFVRSFTLPMSVLEEKVTAHLKDGLLTVILPKRKITGGARMIEIQVD